MRRLLLLDLDGVVVTRDPRASGGERALLLHPELVSAAREIGCAVEVLTHRSRAEAEQIVRALPTHGEAAPAIMAARDLVLAALAAGDLHGLLTRGILKVFALARLERKYGIPRRHMAMLDDSPGNVRTATQAGIGLAIEAPAPVFDAAGIHTFRAAAAIEALAEWAAGPAESASGRVLPRDQHVAFDGLEAVPIRVARLAGVARRFARRGRRLRRA